MKNFQQSEKSYLKINLKREPWGRGQHGKHYCTYSMGCVSRTQKPVNFFAILSNSHWFEWVPTSICHLVPLNTSTLRPHSEGIYPTCDHVPSVGSWAMLKDQLMSSSKQQEATTTDRMDYTEWISDCNIPRRPYKLCDFKSFCEEKLNETKLCETDTANHEFMPFCKFGISAVTYIKLFLLFEKKRHGITVPACPLVSKVCLTSHH